jgi:hypothetical protein
VLDRERAARVMAEVIGGKGHPDLTDLEDDTILLCRGPDDHPYEWWIFWFDQDVSDCCVGCFQTDGNEATVIADFHTWIESLCDRTKQGMERTYEGGTGWETISDWMPLPVEYLRRGWITG